MSYDAADNSAKCYSLAVHELRLQGLREGKFKPLDLAEELIATGKAKDYRRIGPHTLYNGDCAGILQLLGKVDAVVTDPPYGIKQANGFDGFGGMGSPIARRQYEGAWDDMRPSDDLMSAILAASSVHVIWGGNYFTDQLPVGRKWLFWDKCQTMPTYSDGEMAWTSINGVATKRIIYNNNGLMAREKDRVHPTQKPVEVMRWCIQQLPASTLTILDPFMGSGTTIVAAQKLGKTGIGIERDPNYFAIACRRIEQAMQQPDLFIETPKPAVQEALAL